MSETPLKTKLNWQCRRGMLELDVILQPFLEKYFDTLSETQQLRFAELLNEADPDLYSWLMGYAKCSEDHLGEIIKTIRRETGLPSPQGSE